MLLIAFVVFNVLALRWLVRWLWREIDNLRQRMTPDEMVDEYVQKEVVDSLIEPFWRLRPQSSLSYVITVGSIITGLLVADFYVIRRLWPWLLP